MTELHAKYVSSKFWFCKHFVYMTDFFQCFQNLGNFNQITKNVQLVELRVIVNIFGALTLS